MRVRSTFLLAVLLATAMTALAPEAVAQAPLAPGVAELHLSPVQAALEGVGEVETLTTAPPGEGEVANRTVSGDGGSWYALPPSAEEFLLNGTVNGTIHYRAVVQGGLVVDEFEHDVTVDLRKLTINASEVSLGSVTAQVSLTQSLLMSQAQRGQFQYSFNLTNASLVPGEVLLLNVSSSEQFPVAQFQVLYGTATNDSLVRVPLERVTRGEIALLTQQAGREAPPGQSVTYTITVRNLAAADDTVRFEASGAPATWTVLLSTAEETIPAGSASTLLATVTVPADAQGGTEHVTSVRATSDLGAPPAQISLTTRASAAPPPGPVDGDDDGWSDVEELRYSSDPDDPLSTPTTEDSDGDGVSNKEEIDAGTDPFDAGDFPGAQDRGRGNGGTGRAGDRLLAPLGDPLAQALDVNESTADLIALGLILLLFLIILLLLWLLLGGYPVKLSLVEPRAATSPGHPVDYTVEVRSRIGRNQSVDLEAAQVPSDWEVRFTKPRFTLGAKDVESVGLLVRPPGAWPAPSKREFEVRARSRLKPRKFARAKAKLDVEQETGVREAPGMEAPPLEEEAYAEPAPLPPPPPFVEHEAEPYVPPPPPPAGAPPFQVRVRDVRHDPPAPERGSEVTSSAIIDNLAGHEEHLRVVLVVNGRIRDEVTTDLAPGESVEAQFRWTAAMARNEVKVVAERQAA